MPLEVIIDRTGKIAYLRHRFDVKALNSVINRLIQRQPFSSVSVEQKQISAREINKNIYIPPPKKDDSSKQRKRFELLSKLKRIEIIPQFDNSKEKQPATQPTTQKFSPYQMTKEIKELTGGTYSSFYEKGAFEITEKETWQLFWKSAMAVSSPIPPLPKVDFSKERIVALFAGNKPSTLYQLQLTGAKISENKIEIFAIEIEPADNCMVIRERTQPHRIIKIPRDNKKITVYWRKRKLNCLSR